MIAPVGSTAATIIVSTLAPPEDLVACIEVDPQAAIAFRLKPIGDLRKDRRGWPLQEKEDAPLRHILQSHRHRPLGNSAGTIADHPFAGWHA
ncbi:hypothetical protein [Rhizobium herbae]|uniref:Uncharacterized protein n=1 Tax=Rhizobium herbae TaxID=508661 RepID=A0ABS4EJZ8_9HYPH|nr:hypothetical protein [Rhizobium herbae]MBP1858264.1 hypothetical protein [Rhizobium herbae]